MEFALCLFFAKLVSYTFLYWLPQYIKEVMASKYDHLVITFTVTSHSADWLLKLEF